jgi:hypothetical protein
MLKFSLLLAQERGLEELDSEIMITGNQQVFGHWNLTNAIKLESVHNDDEDSTFFAEVETSTIELVNGCIEFKFVSLRNDCPPLWERLTDAPFENRVLRSHQLPDNPSAITVVNCVWNKKEMNICTAEELQIS